MRVNIWTIRRDEKRDRCREVAVSVGSTVIGYCPNWVERFA